MSQPIESIKRAENLVTEWLTKNKDLKFMDLKDYEQVIDDPERLYNGSTLDVHAREYLNKKGLDQLVIDVLVDNFKTRKWPEKLKDDKLRNEYRHTVEDMKVFGDIAEAQKYEFNTHEIDFCYGIVLRNLNTSFGDDFNLPVGYIICIKFEKL